jgi:hypothetical protein
MLKSLIAGLDLAGRKKALDELHKNEMRLKEAERIAHFGWWEREFNTNRVLLSGFSECSPPPFQNGINAG